MFTGGARTIDRSRQRPAAPMDGQRDWDERGRRRRRRSARDPLACLARPDDGAGDAAPRHRPDYSRSHGGATSMQPRRSRRRSRRINRVPMKPPDRRTGTSQLWINSRYRTASSPTRSSMISPPSWRRPKAGLMPALPDRENWWLRARPARRTRGAFLKKHHVRHHCPTGCAPS